MNKIESEKQYQVWVSYGSEGWQPNDFYTFDECVEFLKADGSGTEKRITRKVSNEMYLNKIIK